MRTERRGPRRRPPGPGPPGASEEGVLARSRPARGLRPRCHGPHRRPRRVLLGPGRRRPRGGGRARGNRRGELRPLSVREPEGGRQLEGCWGAVPLRRACSGQGVRAGPGGTRSLPFPSLVIFGCHFSPALVDKDSALKAVLENIYPYVIFWYGNNVIVQQQLQRQLKGTTIILVTIYKENPTVQLT